MNQWSMTWKQKLNYFWTYYKYRILGGLICIAIIVYALIYSIGIHKDTYMQITIVNADAVNVENSKLFDIFEETYCDTEYEELEVEAMLKINMDDSSQLTGTSYQVLSGKFLIGEIDLFISDINTFTYLSQNHCFANLEEILSKNEIEKYQKYFVYQTDEEDGEQYPAGISLKESIKFQKENFYQEEAVMGIGSTASNQENTVKMLSFLFDEN